MVKTEPINIMTTKEVKKKLKEKAKALHLSITQYIEKIALEPVIFLDENNKLLLKHLKIN